MDEQRALLDQLMGVNRDGGGEEKVTDFADDSVCKYFLLDMCPHVLLHNAKGADLGPCSRDHNELAKIAYDELKDDEKAFWNREFSRQLFRRIDGLIEDADRKYRNGLRRIQREFPEVRLPAEIQSQINDLKNQAKDMTRQAEEAAEQGNVSSSQKAMTEVDRIRKEIEELNTAGNARVEAMKARRETVCKICGVLMELPALKEDGEQPELKPGYVHPHENGSRHKAYVSMTTRLAELKESIAKWKEEGLEDADRDRLREERDKRSPKSNGRDRSRSEKNYINYSV